jgi:hypothetical protein
VFAISTPRDEVPNVAMIVEVEKVRLKVDVGPRVVVLGDGTPFKKQIAFSVINLGERPVTIESVGWTIGKGKGRRFAIQPVSGPFTSVSHRDRPWKGHDFHGVAR